MTAPNNIVSDPEQDVSIFELIGRAADNVHGTVNASNDCYSIMIENIDKDSYVNISISGVISGSRGLSLEITNGCMRDKSINTQLQLIEISNLYIAYDTAEIISFCYSQTERFSLVSIFADARVEVWEGIDRRMGKQAELPEETHHKRRRLFSLGRLVNEE